MNSITTVAVGGFLNVHKEPGWTSTDVVRKVKGLTGVKKVGHGGTLDPIASGVLPICLGVATRFAETILMGGKMYTLTVRLGVATDTYDAEGAPVKELDPSGITEQQVLQALSQFTGRIDQTPPMYSAVKHKGRRLYELARAGVEVERKARQVDVYSLRMSRWVPPELELQVECGRGFYARSLAHDLGIVLGNAAHLSGLIRTRSGRFLIEEASTVDEIASSAEAGNWQKLLMPVDFTLQDMRAVVLDPMRQELVQHGQALPISEFGGPANGIQPGERVRGYSRDGRLLAILVYEPQKLGWRPEKVISPV
ncbi:MAG: tRNA pseudouridine(55) synthase TruB [Dehalococcoidia bacterium]